MKRLDGEPLLTMTRRFSAVDARHLTLPVEAELVDPEYTLGEQLFVQPDAKVSSDVETLARAIEMSKQEVAVALSHIGVWQRVAEGDVECTLILEDDGYFTRRFSREFARAWAACIGKFDVLYLSHKYVGEPVERPEWGNVFAPRSGVWQLSGYVLTRDGAARLLAELPVRGPVDLWINHRFKDLRVLATHRSIIGQRGADSSSNDYSILPMLSQVGALSDSKPHLPPRLRLHGPVFVAGTAGLGIAETALAMLGYRCLSGWAELPVSERTRLVSGKRGLFNAYVGIAELSPTSWPGLASRYPDARFVWMGSDTPPCTSLPAGRFLTLESRATDPWLALSESLGLPYPAHSWPASADDRPVRRAANASLRQRSVRRRNRKWDRSPWIVDDRRWSGIAPQDPVERMGTTKSVTWTRRSDTFPGNLAVFDPDNVLERDNSLTLTVEEKRSPARDFAAGALASTEKFRFGKFSAEIRAAATRGVVTGFFLHRNGPRQEIDVEIAGNRPTQMLVNVFFNPGMPGDKFEYGYRGTPIEIDLGFDASLDFHRYEIEWWPEVIRWLVDGRLVHERHEWNPTPIPQHAMELNVNLWPTRSRELAGRLDAASLPAQAHVRNTTVSEQSKSKTRADEDPSSAGPASS